MGSWKRATVLLLGAMLSACSTTASPALPAAGGSNVTLTIAAVQGVEDTGLKALAPMYTAEDRRQDRHRRGAVRRPLHQARQHLQVE